MLVHLAQPHTISVEPAFGAEDICVITEYLAVTVDYVAGYANYSVFREVKVVDYEAFSGDYTLQGDIVRGREAHGLFDDGLAVSPVL